jgi:muramoyltetrapeptide carboxypeptidase LdcA involved in peptidoglycan recycling
MTPPRHPAKPHPAKPRPGDQVAVLSPSSGLPGLFPLPYELGLRRLRDDFGLKPVEYPTTRTMGATPERRAADIHAAFADPGIKAVIASVGGDDQITVLVVEGAGWGGNLEIISWLLMADRTVRPAAAYAGNVLFLETSEDMPRAQEVYWILRNMGERGLLGRFPALLMGRAKSWSFENRLTAEEKARFRREQREAVLRALDQYAPGAMAVFDVDFGHTDPQLVIPVGGRIRVDGPARRITVTY